MDIKNFSASFLCEVNLKYSYFSRFFSLYLKDFLVAKVVECRALLFVIKIEDIYVDKIKLENRKVTQNINAINL